MHYVLSGEYHSYNTSKYSIQIFIYIILPAGYFG